MDEYTKSEEQLNITWREELFQKGYVGKASFNEEEYFKIENYGTVPQEIFSKVKAAYSTFISCQNNVTAKMMAVNNLEEDWKAKRKIANEAAEVALEYWRESPVYVAQLNFFKSSLKYSYLDGHESSSDANNLARSFIYVSISICDGDPINGFNTADMLLQRVKKVVPAYVETNMTVPDGYSGTNCQRITRTDGIRLTNPNYTTIQAIKYAILFGVVAAVLTSVLIIFLDGADQRLRDTEVITKKFNVPLLGIVPTIDELKAEQLAKKVEETVKRKKKKAEAIARKRQEKADLLMQKRLAKKNKEEKK